MVLTPSLTDSLKLNSKKHDSIVFSKASSYNQRATIIDDYSKLTCDSLLLLLIKSSSIEKIYLSERIGIDSVKGKIVYLTFSHINKENGTDHVSYSLHIDLNKRQLINFDENPHLLNFNAQLLNYIIERKCYFNDVDNVTDTTQTN